MNVEVLTRLLEKITRFERLTNRAPNYVAVSEETFDEVQALMSRMMNHDIGQYNSPFLVVAQLPVIKSDEVIDMEVGRL